MVLYKFHTYKQIENLNKTKAWFLIKCFYHESAKFSTKYVFCVIFFWKSANFGGYVDLVAFL